MAKLSLTRRKLIDMLRENTGRALCDSGDAYGRHWQRNQARAFEAEPASTLEIRKGYRGGAEISVTHNVYHWLAERVDYDPCKTRALHKFAKRADMQDETWLGAMKAWAESNPGWAGIYGDGKPFIVNTYNGEDMLSQTLQYLFFHSADEDHDYIALQIHGGCDVRGGYTAPRVFRCSIEEYSILDNARAVISDGDTHWTTDDGCHWYHEGSCGLGAGAQLETYDVSEDEADRGQGKIYVKDGVAYSPINGQPLRVSPY